MTYNPEVTRSKLVEGIHHLFLFTSGHMSNSSGGHTSNSHEFTFSIKNLFLFFFTRLHGHTHSIHLD